MKYCALVNTAHPAAGFISVGDVLTEKQVNALGAEKVAELVRDKVLKALPGECGPGDGRPDSKPEAGEVEYEVGEDTEYGAEEAEVEEAEEDMPELDIADEIVSDMPEEPATTPTQPTPVKRGRRKNG